MIYHTRQKCVEEGVEAALYDRPRPGKTPKLSDKQCAQVIATACTPSPAGHDHWTLRLLADKVVQLGYADSFSYETVRRLLKNTLKPWQVQEWCIPEVTADFVAAMEDVLDLYEVPYDPARPVVCYDERPKQLNGEVREFIPSQPGRPACQDTEYRRNEVRDLMMICEPKRGCCEVLVMERRTRIEFALCMRHIVQYYPDAEVVRVVLDNLNTHKMASLYEAFSPDEARAIARKREFHYTPKHGSWLNIVEIELAVLSNSCLSRRISDELALRHEVDANVRERNAKAVPVKWKFTAQEDRRKLARLYPCVSQ